MAKTAKQLTAVGPEFLADSKKASTRSRVLPFPADVVFRSLKDGEAWTRWLPLTKVTWTSPEPFGVGTTRTVEIGANHVDEYFYAWDEGRLMAFYGTAATLPISALAEEYRVEPKGEGCELIWVGRIGAPPLLRPLIQWQFARGFDSGLAKLETYLAENRAKYEG